MTTLTDADKLTCDQLAASLQKLTINPTQTFVNQHLGDIYDSIDDTGLVKQECAKDVTLVLNPHPITTFLQERFIFGQADVSLVELLTVVFQRVKQATFVGEELATFLATTLSDGLQQLNVKANFVKSFEPPRTLTFRFETDKHALTALRVKCDLESHFIKSSRVFSNEEQTLSGVTLFTNTQQKFHFVFASPELPPCVATCDALQLVLTPDYSYSLQCHCSPQQWLIDTSLKILRPLFIDTSSLPLCIRYIRKGFFPSPQFCEAFKKLCPKDRLLPLWLQLNNEDIQHEVVNAFIITHLANRVDIETTTFLSKISQNMKRYNTPFATALQLVAEGELSFDMVESTLKVAAMLRKNPSVTIDERAKALEFLSDDCPVRLALNMKKPSQILNFPFHKEKACKWFLCIFQTSNYSEILEDLARRFMQEKHPDITAIAKIATNSTNLSFQNEAALFLRDKDPHKALELMQKLLDHIQETQIDEWITTFPLQELLFERLLQKFGTRYLPQLLKQNTEVCLNAYKKLADSPSKLQILVAMTQCCDTSFFASQFVQAWANVLAKSPSFDLSTLFTPLLRACLHYPLPDKTLWRCLQACASVDGAKNDPNLYQFLTVVFNRTCVQHCPHFLEILLQHLLTTPPSFTVAQIKHIRIELQAVIDASQTMHQEYLVLLALQVYKRYCNNAVLSEDQKRALIESTAKDLLNGSKSTREDCRWYFSQMAHSKTTKLAPYTQAVVLISACTKFPDVVTQIDALKEYVSSLNNKVTSDERQALKPQLATLPAASLAVFSPFQTVTTATSAASTTAPQSELALLVKQQKWLLLAQNLLTLGPTNDEAKKLAPQVVPTLLKALKTDPKPLGIIFDLIQKFQLVDCWMKAFKQFHEDTNSEGFSTAIECFTQSKEWVPKENQKTIWNFILYYIENNDLLNKKGLCLLQEISTLKELFKDNFKIHELQQALAKTLDRCLDLLSQNPDLAKKHFAGASALLGIIEKEFSKTSLSWKLFSLFKHDPSPQNFRLITSYLESATMYLVCAFDHLSSKKLEQKKVRTQPQNSLGPILASLKTYLDVSHSQDPLPKEFFFLLGTIGDTCEFVEVHRFLIDALYNHKDINVVALLLTSIEFLNKNEKTFSQERYALFNQIINRIMKEGNAAALARAYAFFFVDSQDPPSRCKSASFYCKERLKKESLSTPLKTDLLKKSFTEKYQTLLEMAKNDPLVAHTTLDIAFSIFFSYRVFANQIHFEGHIDNLIALLLAVVQACGWNQPNLNYFYFILYLVVSKKYVKKDAPNCPYEENYECLKKETIHTYFYKDALVAVGLPVIRKKIDTQIDTPLQSESTLLQSENNYCILTTLFIRQALTKREQNKTPATLCFLDFAVQNLKMLLDFYPKQVDKTLFARLVKAVDVGDLLFSKHREIVVSLLRFALYKKVFTPQEIQPYLSDLQTPQNVLDEHADQISEIKSKFCELKKTFSPNGKERFFSLLKELSLWQQFYCTQSLQEYSDIFFVLCEILQNHAEELYEKDSDEIPPLKLFQAIDCLIFPNGLMFGLDRDKAGKKCMLDVTKTYIDSVFKIYAAHVKSHPDKAALKFENAKDPAVQHLRIPLNRKQALFFLESILVNLKKMYESQVFVDHEEMFFQYCVTFLKCLEDDHHNRTTYLSKLIVLPLHVFTMPACRPENVSHSIKLIDRFFKIFQQDRTLYTSVFLDQILREILCKNIIEKTQTKDDAKIVLGWLKANSSISDYETLSEIAKQVNKVTFLKPLQIQTLYDELPSNIKPWIV